MKTLSQATKRFRYLLSAWVLIIAALVPILTQGTAHAAIVQVTGRYIKMSSSAVSAATTTYNVHFVQTSSNIKSIVVDFCANSPIVGDTCTATVGTNVPSVTASPAITPNSGITGVYTAASANSNRTLTLTKAAGDSSVTTVDFDITTMTNPSATGTFYARVLTFPNDTGTDSAANYTATAPGSANYNYGGIALSTAAQLIVTAKVQESLTFCVYTSGSACSGSSGTAVTLGDANGVLANTAITYQSTQAKFGVATNAQSGVIVRMKGTTLTSGSNTITQQGTSCTADSTTTTVEQFGMRISTLGTNVVGDVPYNCSSTNHGFDGNGSTGTTSTYGQAIAHSTGALDEAQSTLEFSAKSATSTEAGVYTTTLTFIATGTY